MAAALAEDSLSLAPAPHTYRPPTLGTGVTVLFERKGRADGQQLMTTAVLNGSTSVHEIKLTGRHRGWFREDDRLVRPFLGLDTRYLQTAIVYEVFSIDCGLYSIKLVLFWVGSRRERAAGA